MAGLCHERQNCPTPGFFEFVGLTVFAGFLAGFLRKTTFANPSDNH
jgi:hypothetical protein